jgi:hypothetical protein
VDEQDFVRGKGLIHDGHVRDGLNLLIGLGPDADRRAKLLICQAVKGSLLDAYSQFRQC